MNFELMDLFGTTSTENLQPLVAEEYRKRGTKDGVYDAPRLELRAANLAVQLFLQGRRTTVKVVKVIKTRCLILEMFSTKEEGDVALRSSVFNSFTSCGEHYIVVVTFYN